jgi:hypothetical protein
MSEKGSQMPLFFLALMVVLSAPSLASAQSILNRVLVQIDAMDNLVRFNGIYVNIAESVVIAGMAIDGSLINFITGPTQEAFSGGAVATELGLRTVDFGNMTTTALGTVNTGEIFPINETDQILVGINSTVEMALMATAEAVSSRMTQVGGAVDTGALMLNVSSNTSAVNSSIQNMLFSLNGTIGDLSPTALGAVNTGRITSGVNATVQGIVGMPRL